MGGGGDGVDVFNEGKRQTTNIHKVSEGRRLNACGREERV